MKLGGMGAAGRELRALLEGGATAGLTDGQLLARFSSGRGDASAEVAFAALVARHGPMVWGTCRRILRDPHAAEDAFQATFLVLVKKAGSVRVDDSLGRWLHGVGVRVALRAKAVEGRRSGADLLGVEPSTPPREPGLDDLRAAIDEEVDRLPSAYRSVVVLCHLEGLTRERAASRLGCPVGTVNSRLSRAGDLLRARLTRRGLAPASGALAAWLAASGASAAVPTKLVGSTVSTATRVASGGSLAGVVPASVAALFGHYLRGKLMIKTTMAMVLLIGVGFAAVGSAGLARNDEGAKSEPPSQANAQEPAPVPPSLDERVKATKAEWDTARAKYSEVWRNAKTEVERAEAEKLFPDVTRYGEKFLALADTDLDNPAARDALLWMIEQLWILDGSGGWTKYVGRAMDRLLEHHSDDLKVARACLSMDRYTSPNRDKFIPAIYEKAKAKRTRGVAALALAQYRWKASLGAFGRKLENRPFAKNELGEILPISPEMEAYDKARYESDPVPLRAEAFRLLDEVIRDHADEPYDSKKGTTLGRKARELFDDWANLSVGKPAPDFEGKGLDGKPLKLSDYRGKVVVVVFWASWCGPCLRQIPKERELAERLKDRPFALLGVNCDEDAEAARKVVRDERITWPNASDGSKQVGPCEVDMGPIAGRYHVRGLPSVFVLDAKGVIRRKMALGDEMDKAVDELLGEMEPAASTK